jgi:hypothetical protein
MSKNGLVCVLIGCLLAVIFLNTSACAAETAKPRVVKKDRILFLGNSITLHAPAEHIGWTGNWGMAASAAEKDYVHLVVKALSKPGQAEAKAFTPKTMVENIATFERKYASFSMDERLKKYAAFKPTLVILAIGENVPALATEEAETQFFDSVRKPLRSIKDSADPTIIVRSSFWPDAAKDKVLKRAAADAGGIFVDISKLSKDEGNYARSERKFEHKGVAAHPGDKGMKAIADAIVGAIKKAETPKAEKK